MITTVIVFVEVKIINMVCARLNLVMSNFLLFVDQKFMSGHSHFPNYMDFTIKEGSNQSSPQTMVVNSQECLKSVCTMESRIFNHWIRVNELPFNSLDKSLHSLPLRSHSLTQLSPLTMNYICPR